MAKREGQRNGLEYKVWRTPRNRGKQVLADCKTDEEEAREFSSSVEFSKGSHDKYDIVTSWDDIPIHGGGKYITKPKNRDKNRDTIRQFYDEEENVIPEEEAED